MKLQRPTLALFLFSAAVFIFGLVYHFVETALVLAALLILFAVMLNAMDADHDKDRS
jgi:hypothetical protein